MPQSDLMRFDEFMDAALYGPAGFFSSGRGAGRRHSDFITSPEVGPLFGAVVADYLDSRWEKAGRPAEFHVVEAGAGRGALAIAVLAAAPECAGALRYWLVERSDALRASQSEHLDIAPEPAATSAPGGRGPVVHSVAGVPDDLSADVIVANELLDNLQFRVFQKTGESEASEAASWSEWWVDPEPESPGLTLVGADPGLSESLSRLAPSAPDGAVVPLQSLASLWVGDALSRCRGTLVVFDYCSDTAELARRPWQEWLRTFAGQERGRHPLADPGRQDITADVCVDQLPPPDVNRSQRDWLVANGIEARVAEARRSVEASPGIGNMDSIRVRSTILEAEALMDPGGLGGFRALEWSPSTPE